MSTVSWAIGRIMQYISQLLATIHSAYLKQSKNLCTHHKVVNFVIAFRLFQLGADKDLEKDCIINAPGHQFEKVASFNIAHLSIACSSINEKV